jgi:DivIVA domain-containing protein
MPLTAADVRATKFSTTRMRSGYDMDEVDAFLDIIEADVAQYADELQRSRDGEAVLRTQCDQLQVRMNLAEQRLADAQADLAARPTASAVEPAVVMLPAEPEPPEDVSDLVADNPEAVSVLALAQRTADEILRYAEIRAEGIRGSVRAMLTEQLTLVDPPA